LSDFKKQNTMISLTSTLGKTTVKLWNSWSFPGANGFTE